MTDLISREAAIALLKSEFYEQCPKSSVQRILFANAIDALTNMPSAVSEMQEEIDDLQRELQSWQDADQYPRDYR